ncbi:TonB-dependent receptor [Hyphobacterium sp.]|uniref:TonB-dependent receptor n=1 Tax=Hyphobacterium sp. TaxID=2004662 RepID=UPI003BAB352C
MTHRNRSVRLAVLLASVSLLPVIAAPVAAQDETSSMGEPRDTVTVTARRREESIMDVPLSVTAFSGEALETAGAQDITFVGQTTPNVTLEVSRGTNSTLTAFIRGVGQQDPVAGFESGVGLYLDDVYLNRPQAAVLDIYDVQAIEVLRGPQGTLYGRNTIGGAVKYITRRLDPDAPTLNARLNIGSYEQIDAIVSGSVPLSETFRVGGAVASLNRGGYGSNLVTGEDNYNKEVLAFRASAEFEPNAQWFFRLSGDTVTDDSAPRQGHRLIPGALSGAPVLNDVYDTRAGLNVVDQQVEASGGTLLAEYYHDDNWSFRSVTAYREDESTTPIDFDSLPADDLDVPAIYENDQFSQEFQILYEGDRISGVGGVYYLDANASTVFDVVLGPLGSLIGLPGLNAQTFGDVSTETWSVFADISFDLNDWVSASIGGRYTNDERTSRVLRRTYIGGFSEFFGGNPILIATTSDFQGSAEWEDFSPRASLNFTINDENSLYGAYSQGFKGGSFDPRGQTTATPDFNGDGNVTADEIFQFMGFDPEEVDSYEVGWRYDNGRYRHALAVFFMDYKDVQIPGSVGVDTDGDGVNDTFTGVTTNAAEAEIRGLEYEGSLLVSDDVSGRGDSLSLDWAIGLLDGEYGTFINAFGQNISNQVEIQNTPDVTAAATLTYVTPVRNGDLTILNTLAYRGDSTQFEIPFDRIDQDAFTLWNASIVWDSDDGRWQFGLHGRNLTDERYIVAGYDFVNNTTLAPELGLEGTLTAFYGDPRTVTGTIAFRY